MGNMSVLYEIGSLMWSHPYVSCSLLVFLTPPFFPILKFFSPLLISTALFVVALVTMGPQFEEPLDEEDDFLINASEFKALGEEETGSRKDDGGERERDVKYTTFKLKKDVRSSTSWSDWVKSWKESGISWVEKKLQNENWKGSLLNDDNVSILEEAFAHRAEEKPTPVLTKLLTRRIPDEEERVVEEEEEPGDQSQRQADVIPALSHSDSWTSDRSSFDRFTTAGMSNTRELPPHNFFSPHPSFSRRHDSDVNPLFENVIPPPIDYDMPPLITGPASITDPLFKSLEDDMDTSDDEYDHHHCDHDLLEVGESTVDANLVIPHNDQIPMANGTHHQPVEMNLASLSDEGSSAFQENAATESSPPSTHVDSVCTGPPDIDVTETHEESAPPAPELGLSPSAEERSIPANSEESHPALGESSSQPNVEELHDVPELEDVLPVENVSSHEINPAESSPASLPDEVHDTTSEAPTHHASEVLSASTEVSMEPPSHVVERSMSLPVHGSPAETGSHDDSAPTHGALDDASLPEEEAPPPSASLSHAISLPAVLHPIPPETTDRESLSLDTEVGTATTSDHGKEAPETAEQHNSIVEDETSSCAKQSMSTQDKILNMEPLSNSIPAAEDDTTKPAPPVEALQAATTEETKSIVEDISPSKEFQPDAPQLQITPPSSKVVLTPPRVKSPSADSSSPVLGRASIRPQPSFTSRYSSSDDESGDEEIDLDSDVEIVGEDSDSEVDMPPPLPVRSGVTRLKAPPKPPADQILPAHTVVQA